MAESKQQLPFSAKIWITIFGSAIALNSAVVGLTFNRVDRVDQSINAHAERLAAIESNRFTASDGLEIWKEISKHRSEIAAIPREVPPAWFLDRVDRLEARLDELIREVRNGSGSP